MDKIAVLIPCYNEETTIGKVIDDFKVALPEATIYVYDNNSTDQWLLRMVRWCGVKQNRERGTW